MHAHKPRRQEVEVDGSRSWIEYSNGHCGSLATVLQRTRREDKEKGRDVIHVSTFIKVYLQHRCSVSSILPVGLNFRLTLVYLSLVETTTKKKKRLPSVFPESVLNSLPPECLVTCCDQRRSWRWHCASLGLGF